MRSAQGLLHPFLSPEDWKLKCHRNRLRESHALNTMAFRHEVGWCD